MKKKSAREGEGKPDGPEVNVGGLFKGLAGLVETLGQLAETGQKLQRTGEIHGAGNELKGIYGFSVKVGLDDQKLRVEPFGNIHRDKKSGATVVQEIREPVVDVFEEKDYVLIVAELPGISAGDVKLELKDDVLTLSAEKGEKKYRKEVLLPGNFAPSKISHSCNNGVLEIKCLR